jgi:ATP adenylyltransferase
MKKSVLKVDPRNARAKGYKEILQESIQENACPLCPPMKWHPNPILKYDDKWLVTENSHPYPNTKHHLIFVSKKHIEELSQLTGDDLNSIISLAKWATKEFKIKGGGLTLRFGDTLYTGATIKHLHAHLIVPSTKNNKVTPVYFPIG